MPVERCVDLIVGAIRRERRDVVMTIQGKLGAWVKLIAPGIVDAIAKRSVEEAPKD